MIGVGGIAGFGNVDLSAWLGLNGVGSLASTATAPTSGLSATALAPTSLGQPLQVLLQLLQQFSLTEILLALLLASSTSRCRHSHEHDGTTDGFAVFALASALIQQGTFHQLAGQMSFVPATSAATGMTVNVAG
jgi:hypothetical protein